jgi:phosphoribosyl 1,2-cyclic phosphodiesterase
MQLKIWGCRGSVPSPGPTTVVCGGNTSCVELSLDDGTVLVLDAGTGIRDLGDDLVERGVRRIHLLLTHLHLDHVEGLRFFGPMWDKNVVLDVWGPPSTVLSLEDSIARTFSPPLFPIDLGVVPAQVAFHDAPRQPWKVESALVTAALVVHPGPTLGYRIEADGSTIAYLPDHEPALTGIEERSSDWISGAAIAEGVDVLLHDAQYFEDEYEERIGWGHSSVSDTIAYAQALRVGRLVLFHHEPQHSDDALSGLEDRAQQLVLRDGGRPTLAREGMVVELPS